MKQIDKIYEMLDNIIETEQNRDLIQSVKDNIEKNDLMTALADLKKIKELGIQYKKEEEEDEEESEEVISNDYSLGYPEKLADDIAEERYIGVLLNELKLGVMSTLTATSVAS